MKQPTLQESYTKFLKNELTKSQFQKLIYTNQHAKKFVTPANSLEDSIKILKVKHILSEDFQPGFGDQVDEPMHEDVEKDDISEMIDKLLGEYRNITIDETDLPDSYDDDLKAAGLA